MNIDESINAQARAIALWAIEVESDFLHPLRVEIDAHNQNDASQEPYAARAVRWWVSLNTEANNYSVERMYEIIPAFLRGHSGSSAYFTIGKALSLVTSERHLLVQEA